MEIAKLKDMIKKGALMHKDTVESYAQMTRFEINNFYDGMEQEFNILDQKKNTVFDSIIYENRSLRKILPEFYQRVFALAKEISGILQSKKKLRPGEGFSLPQLPAAAFNKPMNLVEKDIEESISLLVNEIWGLVSERWT